jgi:hypothetical protein
MRKLGLVVACAVLMAAPSRAEEFRFDGLLVDGAGAPVSAKVDAKVCISKDPLGKQVVHCWSQAVSPKEGWFAAGTKDMGFLSKLSQQETYYLDMTVNGVHLGPGYPLTGKLSHMRDITKLNYRVVDCTKGESINEALKSANHLLIKGVCTEDVVVNRDDVTLRGVDGSSGIHGKDETTTGAVVLDGARRVYLDNLDVAGPGVGIGVLDNSALVMTDVRLHDTHRAAIEFLQNSSGLLVDSDIYGSDGNGIEVDYSSSIFVAGTLVHHNKMHGIRVGNASFALIDPFFYELAEVLRSDKYVVEVLQNHGAEAFFRGKRARSEFFANAQDGIHVQDASAAEICKTTAKDNGWSGIAVTGSSSIMLCGDNAFSGNKSYGIMARSSVVTQYDKDLPDRIENNGMGGVAVWRSEFNAKKMQIVGPQAFSLKNGWVEVSSHVKFNGTVSCRGNGNWIEIDGVEAVCPGAAK